MSTWGKRDFRPLLHYTPPFGWINDPNGLVYDNGKYHLFAQYYPYATHWGPMHWIHGVSEDLLHWQQIGIALQPDYLGFIFSGSAIIDTGNTSGLGDGCDPMIAMFTHHGEKEQQSIAFSNDRINFTKYEGNPVIPNPGFKDFRDPKIFKNRITGNWSVVVAAGDHVEFYASKDIKSWIKTGEFGAKENLMGSVFECPNLVELDTPSGGKLWVLTASIIQPHDTGGNRTQYFLGEFDGETFHQTVPFDKPELIDSGYDNYAAVSFNGINEPILMGWGTSWTYAADEPTNEFCGMMTCARKMAIVDTLKGPRLACTPILPEGNLLPIKDDGAISGETFLMHVESDSAFNVQVMNDAGECFDFGLDETGAFYTDRSKAGRKDFNALFASDLYSATNTPRLLNGHVSMDVLFDRCLFEIFADKGTYVNSTLVYPDNPYTKVVVNGDATLTIRELT